MAVSTACGLDLSKSGSKMANIPTIKILMANIKIKIYNVKPGQVTATKPSKIFNNPRKINVLREG
jgi:hypothetical protein